jgi:hypothetical protein
VLADSVIRVMMTEAASTSETSINLQQTAGHKNNMTAILHAIEFTFQNNLL